MGVSAYITPGDKIDICYLHQNNGKTYKSSVFDIIGENEIEIMMPTDSGKIIIFNIGFECQLYFYTTRGLYTCEAVVTNRYKKEQFILMSVKTKTALKKFQRREFFRLECLLDFVYYKISNEVADLETTEDLFEEIANPDYIKQKKLARTKDLSGGGMRFTTMESLEVGSKVLAVLRLSNDKIEHMFYLVADIIACDPVPNMPGLWIARSKFKFKNNKDRDLIIRYVFEEDRIRRKRGNG